MKMLKHFILYYKPHIRLFILDFSCAFIIAAMDLVFPLVVGLVIDDVLPSRNFSLLLYISAGLLVLYILRALLQYIVDYWGHVLGVYMEFDMRRDLFDHIQKLSFRYFDNTKTGHIMSRLVNDLNEIAEMAHHAPEDLFVAMVTLGGSFAIMLTINWQLALLTFCLIPVMLLYAIKKNRKMQAAFRETRLKVADINARVEDSISGVRVVKAFTNEPYEKEKFKTENSNFRQAKQNAYHVMALFFSGINFFSNLINLVVITFGGLMVYRGTLTLGILVTFLLYVNMFMQPIRKITILVETYQRGMAGFRRFYETLEIKPDITDKKDAIDAEVLKGNISFNSVTFNYNQNRSILENINLGIAKGENIAIVGPSGGGKTTLCNLIPRFYEVEKGSITIDGIDIRNFTQQSLRKNIGIVQQDVFLFSGSVRENIAYGKLNTSDEEIISAAKDASAHEFIMSLENGYDTYIGERGVLLSGGQKQRISIARIFLKDPSILILDEATSALDSETEAVIQKALEDLMQNRTALVIAHRLSTIKKANRIIVLTDEGIVETGSHDDLITFNGHYSRLYLSQFKVTDAHIT